MAGPLTVEAAAGSPARSGAGPRIGVNLTWLVPGVVGGSEEYAVRLLLGAAPLMDPAWSIRVYGSAALRAAHPRLVERFEFVPMPISGPIPALRSGDGPGSGPGSLPGPGPGAGRGGGDGDGGAVGRFRHRLRSAAGSKPARIALEQTWLAAVSRRDDLVHHVGGTIPIVRPGPAVVTVHDLQPIDLPANFGPVKRRWLGAMIPYAARNADRVLCPSRFTADRIIDRYGVPAAKVRVVHHGHDGSSPGRRSDQTPTGSPDRTPTPTPDRSPGRRLSPADAELAADPGRYGRYLLYPAIAYAHKRHADVVDVLDRLADRHPDLQVVFTGRDGPETPSLRARAERLGHGDRVHFLGRVPAAELDRLYRRAAAVVFPSAYEGFGNPALEAMLHDCPLVASDAGALPEVVGDAGIIVPVGDVDALTAAVGELLADGALADDLRARGRRRAADFGVEIAAKSLVEVYREALSRGS